MIRMLKAEWYKMIKGKGFKVLCIIALLFGLLNGVISSIVDEEFVSKAAESQGVSMQQIESYDGSSEQIVVPGNMGFNSNGAEDPFNIKSIEVFHMSFGSGIMETFIAVIVGIMVAKEYSEGTIKNTLAYGKKRTTFYIAKFINIVLGSSIIMAIMTVVSTVGNTIIKGWGEEFKISQLVEMARTFAGAVIVFAAVAAVIMFIATLVKSNGATIGISVAIFILLPTIISFLYGSYDWFDTIFELSLYYNAALVTAIKSSASDILRAVTISIITMVIALGGGIAVFKAQDIK